MEFLKSQTAVNLARAFAGESQARTRYSIYAHQASKENLQAIAALFDEVASQELSHASRFLKRFAELAKMPIANMDLDAGYPFEFAGTRINLRASRDHEAEEAFEVYPVFAQTARAEGFVAEGTLFDLVAKIELGHSKLFGDLADALEAGTLYHSDEPVLWRCQNCGHEQLLTDPWQVCPVCLHGQGFVLPQQLRRNGQ